MVAVMIVTARSLASLRNTNRSMTRLAFNVVRSLWKTDVHNTDRLITDDRAGFGSAYVRAASFDDYASQPRARAIAAAYALPDNNPRREVAQPRADNLFAGDVELDVDARTNYDGEIDEEYSNIEPFKNDRHYVLDDEHG